MDITLLDICIISCAFILLDIICGVIAAAKNKVLDSSIMRDGLYNKLAELLFMGLAILCSYALTIEPFNELGVPPEILYLVAVYIAGMELLSIIENICKINPELKIKEILYIFGVDNDDSIDKNDKNSIESKVGFK